MSVTGVSYYNENNIQLEPRCTDLVLRNSANAIPRPTVMVESIERKYISREEQYAPLKRYIMVQAKLSLYDYFRIGQKQHIGRGSAYVKGFVNGIGSEALRTTLTEVLKKRGWKWEHLEEEFDQGSDVDERDRKRRRLTSIKKEPEDVDLAKLQVFE